MVNDTFSLAWFGNTSLATTAFLSPIDGWFKRFEDDSNVEKITIGSTGAYGIAALKEAYESATGQLIRQNWKPCYPRYATDVLQHS